MRRHFGRRGLAPKPGLPGTNMISGVLSPKGLVKRLLLTVNFSPGLRLTAPCSFAEAKKRKRL
jgi:hypothetical protein